MLKILVPACFSLIIFGLTYLILRSFLSSIYVIGIATALCTVLVPRMKTIDLQSGRKIQVTWFFADKAFFI
jgi:hypothetical protein